MNISVSQRSQHIYGKLAVETVPIWEFMLYIMIVRLSFNVAVRPVKQLPKSISNHPKRRIALDDETYLLLTIMLFKQTG